MAKTVRPIPKPQKPRHFVREWRRHRDLTQEQLAERIGKTHSAISQLERGKIDYTQGMLEALAYSLSCEPGDLLLINPLMAGEVVDFTRLIRGADPMLQQAALAAASAVLQSSGGGRPLRFYNAEDEDLDERPQDDGRSSTNRNERRETSTKR